MSYKSRPYCANRHTYCCVRSCINRRRSPLWISLSHLSSHNFSNTCTVEVHISLGCKCIHKKSTKKRDFCILWSTTPNLFPYHIAISLIFSPFRLKNLQQRLECTLHNHKDSFLHQLVLLHSKARDQFERSCVVV